MPYGIRSTKQGFKLYNTITGHVYGIHATKHDAEAQRRAIEARTHGKSGRTRLKRKQRGK